jgi:hypothetical protein
MAKNAREHFAPNATKLEVFDMPYFPIIRNFAYIGVSVTEAEHLRSQLSLTMPPEMLKFCANYYKNQLRRDPFADELQMLDMLVDWIKTDPRGEKYRDLDWSLEYKLAREGDPDDTQTAL